MRIVMVFYRKFCANRQIRFAAEPRQKYVFITVLCHGSEYAFYLFGRFPLREYHFSDALAYAAVMVDVCIAYVLKGHEL